MSADAITLLLALEARDQASRIIEALSGKVKGFEAAVKAAAGTQTRSSAEIEAANIKAAASTASYERAVVGQTEAQTVLSSAMVRTAAATEAQARVATQGAAAQARAAAVVADAAAAEEAALIKLAQAERLAATRAEEMAAAQKAAAGSSGIGAAALKGVTIAAGATALAVGFIAEKSIHAAGEFEKATNLLVVSAGESKQNIDMVRQGMLDMAGQVGASSEQLTHAMLLVERGGQHGADGLKVLRAAAEGAKAENSDLAVVADAVTSILVDYHLKAEDAATVTSKLVAATASGKTTFEEMSKSMASVLPVASAAHVSLDDILGDLAAMTVHGMSAQQSAQNLSDVIRHMQSPTAIQAKELALLGMTTADLAEGLKSHGLSGTLQEISQRIVKLSPPGTDRVILNLKTALEGLSPAVRELGMHLFDGSMSAKQYAKASMALDPISAKQAMSFGTLAGSMHRIGDVQMTGADVMQTYGQALHKATGDATGLNVALMLTGENAGVTNSAIKTVSEATAEAGNHVLGWSEIQHTFNYRMTALKGTLESIKIAIGTGLLPVASALASKILSIVKPVAEWTVRHQQLSAIILGSIGGVAAFVVLVVGAVKAFEMVKIAIIGVRTAMIALKLATMEAGAAFALTPLGWIVIALIAVAAAVFYCWTHFEGFRKVVIAAWEGIKKAAEWAWNNALKPAFEGIKSWIMDQVVPAVMHFWHGAVEPAFRGIAAVASWLWNNIIKPYYTAWYILFRDVLAPAAMWLWRNVLEPAFRGIGAVVSWLWTNVIKPTFDGWVIIFRNVIAPVMMWFWRNVVEPVWNGIKTAIDIAWTVIKVVFELYSAYVKNVLAPIFFWLWKNVIEPVWQGIQIAISVAWAIIQVIWGLIQINIKMMSAAFDWLYHNVIEPVWRAIADVISWAWSTIIRPLWDVLVGYIKNFLVPQFEFLWHSVEFVWRALSDALSTVWNYVIKPVFLFFAGIIKDHVLPAFKTGIDAIGSAWHGLQEVSKAPIKFVVNTILNDGLLAGYNLLAHTFGVKPDNVRIPLPAGFAGGGPVWGAGTETSDSIPALLSHNEHVLTAAEVKRAGGHNAIVAWRQSLMGGASMPRYPGDGSSGIPGFAGGGIVDAIGGVGKGLFDLFTNPAKVLAGPINSLIDRIPGGGPLRGMLVGGAHKLGDGLMSWAKGAGERGGAGAAMSFLRSQVGKPYIWASAGPEGFDCSGIVSAIWNVLHGLNPFQHTFSTMNQAAYFPKAGYGLLTAGWTNPGESGVGGGPGGVGHTAGVLAGLPFESVGGSGVRIGGSVTPLGAFAHVGTYDRGGPIYPGWNAVYNGTRGMERVVDPQGGGQGGNTVIVDLRESKFFSDRDIDVLLDKIDKRLARTLLPGAGMQVRR